MIVDNELIIEHDGSYRVGRRWKQTSPTRHHTSWGFSMAVMGAARGWFGYRREWRRAHCVVIIRAAQLAGSVSGQAWLASFNIGPSHAQWWGINERRMTRVWRESSNCWASWAREIVVAGDSGARLRRSRNEILSSRAKSACPWRGRSWLPLMFRISVEIWPRSWARTAKLVFISG